MLVREYTDKFEDLYKYTKDVYPIEQLKNEKFMDGLYVSLRGKLNLYVNNTFKGWVEKVIEHERLDNELETLSRFRS